MGNTSNLFLQNLSHVPLAQQQLMKFENIHINNVSSGIFFSFWNELIIICSIFRLLVRLHFHLGSLLIPVHPAAVGKNLTFLCSFAETGLTGRAPSYGPAGCGGDRASASLESRVGSSRRST